MKLPQISKYPKKVYVKGAVYRIKFVKGLQDLGNTDSGKNLISIRAGMSKNETFRTFIHELLHLLEFEWPVRLKHKTVYKLEEAIFALLMDNFL